MNKIKLNLALLATDPLLYSHKRLIEEAEKAGHEMRFIETTQCYINLTSDRLELRYRGGEALDHLDGVIPRIGASSTIYGVAIVRQLQQMGIFVLNDSAAISCSRDKLHALQVMAKNNIAIPTTAFAYSTVETEELIQMVKGAPLIIKTLEGTQGKGVILAENNRAANNVIDALRGLRANILVQNFIKEAEGKDIRAIVIGGRIVASMQREAAVGDFRSNLHQGGAASQIVMTQEERIMAKKAAAILGLKFAGVDIIRGKDHSMVLEVNSSPGLEGIETITGKNIAAKVISFMEKTITKKKL